MLLIIKVKSREANLARISGLRKFAELNCASQLSPIRLTFAIDRHTVRLLITVTFETCQALTVFLVPCCTILVYRLTSFLKSVVVRVLETFKTGQSVRGESCAIAVDWNVVLKHSDC
jgi:hypothetical protein